MTDQHEPKTEAPAPARKILCEVFSRVVGYYRPVENWHQGKQQEFADRTLYDISTGVK
jgi:anaerobic ribonucleoside-triphosphate reductase